MQTSTKPSMEHDGYLTTCHPMGKEYKPHEWVERVRGMYEGKEVKHFLTYSNPNYDPTTCPASWLWDASLRPEPIWGIEVIWKDG